MTADESSSIDVVVLGMNVLSAHCTRFLLAETGVEVQGVVPGMPLNDLRPSFKRAWQNQPLSDLPILTLNERYRVGTWGISVGFPRKMKPSERHAFTGGLVNLHLGPLPEYRGALSALTFALLRRAPTYGVTIHAVDDGIDTGDVFTSRAFQLPEDILVSELIAKLEDEGRILFEETIMSILRERVRGRPQETLSPSAAADVHAFRRDETKELFDLTGTASIEDLIHQARALSWPDRSPYLRVSDTLIMELSFKRSPLEP